MSSKPKDISCKFRPYDNKENIESIENAEGYVNIKNASVQDKNHLLDSRKSISNGKKTPLKKVFLKNNLERNHDKECTS